MARRSRRRPVDLLVNKYINGVPHLARTRDLSREGVYLHRVLEPDAPADAHFVVQFELPGSGNVIWAEAEVVHADREDGVGLRFKHLTPRDGRRIAAFVESVA